MDPFSDGHVRTARAHRRPCPRRHVALYSHDSQGLGHVRRNTVIAAALVAARADVEVLLVSGAAEAAELPLPDRTRLAVLPGLAKDALGRYSARAAEHSLTDLLATRSEELEDLLTGFSPDLLIVDKVPRGFRGELEPTLRRLRIEHRTRTVLGLRDVLDDVATTVREWRHDGATDAIHTLYDHVWVYGDPTIFDPAEVYSWPHTVMSKVRYTGYLARDRDRLLAESMGRNQAPAIGGQLREPFVLGLVGGGQDGAAVAAAFANAEMPAGHQGILVTGPYLPAAACTALEASVRNRPNLTVHRLIGDVPSVAAQSHATVSMGGYNAVCELLAAGRPALIVPRVAPRREQAVRAERFASRGLLDAIDPRELTPGVLTAWLADAVTCGHRGDVTVNLDGLDRVPALAIELLEPAEPSGERHAG